MDIPDEVLTLFCFLIFSTYFTFPWWSSCFFSISQHLQVIIPHYQRVSANGERDDSSGVGVGFPLHCGTNRKHWRKCKILKVPIEDLKSLSEMLVKAMEIRERYMGASHQKFPSHVKRWAWPSAADARQNFPSGSSAQRTEELKHSRLETVWQNEGHPLLLVSQKIRKNTIQCQISAGGKKKSVGRQNIPEAKKLSKSCSCLSFIDWLLWCGVPCPMYPYPCWVSEWVRNDTSLLDLEKYYIFQKCADC